jgi:hypothetical protein
MTDELLHSGEAFNRAAWAMIRELMGSDSWSVSDTDQSDWAIKMREFVRLSDAHRAAIAKAAGGEG